MATEHTPLVMALIGALADALVRDSPGGGMIIVIPFSEIMPVVTMDHLHDRGMYDHMPSVAIEEAVTKAKELRSR